MPKSLPDHFTHSHVVAGDGEISFACPTDPETWPWLVLDPFDPIVVQALNYFASYEISIVRGRYEAGQWTALTQTGWTCGEKGVGHVARGISHATEGDGKAGYRMSFYDRDNALVYEMSGEGVVFKNRDFEEWRNQRKLELDTDFDARDFPYAQADAVGVSSQIESFVSIPSDADGRPARGLVTRANGFLPAHPYHDGSGDHVNASHLADAGRQYLRLLLKAPHLRITSGDMQFRRYVELGCPFRITTPDDNRAQNTIVMQIHQADHLSATILMRYASG